MNTLEFIASIIDSLIWPLSIGYFLFLLEKGLGAYNRRKEKK